MEISQIVTTGSQIENQTDIIKIKPTINELSVTEVNRIGISPTEGEATKGNRQEQLKSFGIIGELLEADDFYGPDHDQPDQPIDEEQDGENDIQIENSCQCDDSCYLKFDRENIIDSRLGTQDLNFNCAHGANRQRLFIVGSLNSLWCNVSTIINKTKDNHERKINVTKYMFRKIQVCKTFYMFVNSFNSKRLENLKFHLNLKGITPPIHVNTIRSNSAVLSFNVLRDIRNFINIFADQHGLVLSEGLPSYSDLNLKILSCSGTNIYVYKLFIKAAKEIGIETVKRSSWYNTWKSLCPNIVIQLPRSDLCSTCQNNITFIQHMNGMSEEVKMKRLQNSTEHLKLVMTKRKNYNDRITQIKSSIVGLPLALKPHTKLSAKIIMHYSFDYAEQIHFPFSSQQVGPLYFLTGYKVGLSGVAIEPLEKFVLYFIPEACHTGRGSNMIISMIHHFFENFGLGEIEVEFHADNCSGQTKNNFMMQYLVWRTVVGKHQSIRLSFLPVGHTKFSPDLFFGIFKKLFSRSDVNGLQDLIDLCHKRNCIIPVLVGNQIGDVFVELMIGKIFLQTKIQ